MGKLLRAQLEDTSCGDGRGICADKRGCVEPDFLGRVVRSCADTEHHFASSYESLERRLAIGTRFFTDCEHGRQQGCAGMNAMTRMAGAVVLEGLRKNAVDQGRIRRMQAFSG